MKAVLPKVADPSQYLYGFLCCRRMADRAEQPAGSAVYPAWLRCKGGSDSCVGQLEGGIVHGMLRSQLPRPRISQLPNAKYLLSRDL
jgi:hypothetical protein